MIRSLSKLRRLTFNWYLSSSAAMASSQFNHKPVVVVVGATGAGKSKLALELGQVLNGEIVSADSMQVYTGLDIVTNKVTKEEQESCPHHLIGFLSPLQEYTVVDFQKQARDVINDIHSRNKLPILCGGTSYYIESILWEYLTSTAGNTDDESLLRSKPEANEIRHDLEAMNSSELYEILEKNDPERASRLHPCDRRKVMRSVEIYLQSGVKHSELLLSQAGERRYGGPLLFRNICFLWVQCDENVLHERVDTRVDKMLAAGLLTELQDFHKEYNENSSYLAGLTRCSTDVTMLPLQCRLNKDGPPEYEHGIFQSIGFKEFHKYLTEDLPAHDKERCLNDSIAKMKVSTWQYAKYQMKWLRKRLVNREDTANVYAVDSTDPSDWNEVVYYPSLKILRDAIEWDKFVDGVTAESPVFRENLVENARDIEPIPKTSEKFDNTPRNKRTCHFCGGKVFLTDGEWDVHVKSRRHKRSTASRKRQLNNTCNILSDYEAGLKKQPKTPGDP